MKDVALNIVNAHELDPNKLYIVEMPATSYSMADADSLAEILTELNAKCVVAVRRGQATIKVKEVPVVDNINPKLKETEK